MIGKFVTANLAGLKSTRQGCVLEGPLYKIKGQSGEIYLCDPPLVEVTNPPDKALKAGIEEFVCPWCAPATNYIILGQEAICPDGLGRVVAFEGKFPSQWIQIETYVNDRGCKWSQSNVKLIDPADRKRM